MSVTPPLSLAAPGDNPAAQETPVKPGSDSPPRTGTGSGRSVGTTVLLSLVMIVGLVPFAGDMYLASLPAIGHEFGAPLWLTQLTLTGYLLLLGVGQLVAGPITDAVGRRTPLLVGLGVFIIGSGLAAAAPSMGALLAARALQGIGGAIAVVVANSSVRDRASGVQAMRLFATMMTVAGLAPVLAPAVGGVLDEAFGWRSGFIVLAVAGALVFLTSAVVLKESLPANRRQRLALGSVASGYSQLFRNPAFAMPLVGFAAMFLLLFAYIGGATHVYQDVYGLDPATFGLLFGATGLALMIGPFLAGRLAARVSNGRLALYGVLTALAGTALVLVAALSGFALWVIIAGMAVALIGFGMSEPAFMSMCMAVGSERSGQAAALIGAAQFIIGAGGTVLAGIIAVAGATPWALLLLACTLVALPFAFTRRETTPV